MSENYLQHADHFSRILSQQEITKLNNAENNVINQNFQKNIDEVNQKSENNNLDKEFSEID